MTWEPGYPIDKLKDQRVRDIGEYLDSQGEDDASTKVKGKISWDWEISIARFFKKFFRKA